MELDRFKVLLSVKHCYKTRTDPTGRPKTWLIWWLDRSRFVKKPAGATTRQNPGRPMTRQPRRTRTRPDVFFFKRDFSPIPLFFHIFLVGY